MAGLDSAAGVNLRSSMMKTIATLTFALLLGTAVAAGSAQARTSIGNRSGAAVQAGKAHAGRSGVAASGAGEATAATRAKAKAGSDKKTQADSDSAADVKTTQARWPGPSVDASEIT